MNLKIVKTPLLWKLVDEQNQVVARLLGRLTGPAKTVCSPDGASVYLVDKAPPSAPGAAARYQMYRGASLYAVADVPGPDEQPQDLTVSPAFLFRPPRIQKIRIQAPEGPYILQRMEDGRVTVSCSDQDLGSISPFFKMGHQILSLAPKTDPLFFAGIYVMAYYMSHEDDIDLV